MEQIKGGAGMGLGLYGGRIGIPADAGLPARIRLRELLSDGLEAPLLLLTAPVGYGKTQALADLCRAANARVLWLTLHPMDDSEQGLWAFLSQALGAPLSGAQDCIRALAASHAKRTLLVLDSAEQITDAGLFRALEQVVTARLEGVTLVLAGRVTPPMRLEQLAQDGLLHRIPSGALRLTAEEAGALLAAHGFPLPDAVLEQLLEATGGWPAALHRAALLLEREGYLPPELLLQRIRPGLLALLRQECFDGLAAPERLRQIAASLLPASHELPQDGLIEWDTAEGCRIHPLYRELLRQQLAALEPHRRAALHREAADALLSRQDIAGAAEQLLQAGEAERVPALLERHLSQLVRHNQYGRTLRLLDGVPESGRMRAVLAAVQCGDVLALPAHPPQLLRGLPPLLGGLSPLELCGPQENPQELCARLRQAEPHLRAALGPGAAGLALLCEAECLLSQNLDAARQAAQRAALLGQAGGGEDILLGAQLVLLLAVLLEGEAEAALAIADGAEEELADRPSPLAQEQLVLLRCTALLGTGQSEPAMELLQRQFASAPCRRMAERLQLRLLLQQGRMAELEALLRTAPPPRSRPERLERLLLEALVSLELGDPQAGAQACEALALAQDSGLLHLPLSFGGQLIRLLAALQPQLPDALLSHLREGAARCAGATLSVGQTTAAPLTAREREVLALLCAGLPNRAIAQRLRLSGSTVKWYISQILMKLDVKNRTEAAIKAVREDLL